MTNIDVINASSVLGDNDVAAIIPALQKQVSRDFAAAYGIDAALDFVPRDGKPRAGSWWLSVLDDADAAGALGYHDLTSEGLPLGKIFAGTDLKYGSSWTVTASHELLEMLADPTINLVVFTPDGKRLVAYEVADACEDDSLGYRVDGVLLSDFVTPAFFGVPGKVFDHCEHVTEPLQILPGGYLSMYDIRLGAGWHQVDGQALPAPKGRRPGAHLVKMMRRAHRTRPPVGSRRERRRTLRGHWLRSTAF